MTLNPQEQETTERGKELFREYIGQFSFFALILWIFVILYLFSLKLKHVSMIGGQMLFTTLNTSVVKLWIFLWRILTLPLRCRSS